METKSLIKNSAWVFLATFLGGLILFIANILLAKRFGPYEFGNFKTVINLFCFLPTLIELGVSATLVKYIAEFSDERINILVSRLLKLRVVIYLAVIAILFLLKERFAIYFLKDVSLSNLIVGGIIIFGLFFFEIFKFIVQGFENFKLYAVSQFLTLGSIGLLTTLLGYSLGVFYAIIGWGFGYLVGNSINIDFVFKKGIFRKTPQKLNVKELLLRYGLPIHLMILPGFLGLAVVPVLSPFFSQQLIGYLAFSMIFYQGIIAIPTAFSTVLFPRFSKLSQDLCKAKDTLKKSTIIYTPIVLLGIIGCLGLSKPFIKLIAPSYLPGLIIFKALICFSLISGYFLIYRSYLSGLARLKKLAILTAMQNLALLIISFVVLKKFSF